MRTDKQLAEWIAHEAAALAKGRCPHSGLLLLRADWDTERSVCGVCDCFGYDTPTTRPAHRTATHDDEGTGR